MNTYKVCIKSIEKPDSVDVKTLVEFDCDKERYMYEIEKAVKNSLSFAATDSVCLNETGGKNYCLSIYFW